MSVSGDQGGWCKNYETSSPPKLKFCHLLSQVVPNRYGFLSSVEQKRRYLEKFWKTVDVAIDFYSFFSILWKSMATVSCSQCNLVLWCKAKFFSIITPVLSVTWSFRNHSHVLNRCSRNISSSHQCLTQFIFLIHVFFFLVTCKLFFQDSLMNRKFKWTTFILN